MPYAREILEYLTQRGYTLALASSTRTDTVTRELNQAGLFHFFKTVTCGDMVTHSKPDPEIYRKACDSIGISPDRCAAVEDSPNGILSAYAAGLSPVMVVDQIEPTQELLPKIHRVCRSLSELKDFL